MTMTELPRRPYVEQPPPREGLQAVQTAARGRRRRRTLLVATGCSALAGVSALAVMLSTTSGQDTLRPLPPASHPAPSTSPARVADNPLPTGDVRAGAIGGGTTAGRHHSAVPGGARLGGVRVPTATRTSRSTATAASGEPAVQLHVFRSSPAGSGAQICAGDVSSRSGSLDSGGVGWCEFATARKVAGGVQLTLSACRDDTTGGKLTYSTTREVDIAVERGGRTIWDWAADHPGTPSAHSRQAAANECWNWQLVWPDITQSGASAGHGQFTFVGSPAAQELAGYPPERTTFRY